MRYALAVCLLTLSCAPTSQRKLAAVPLVQRLRIDLGYLDEPRVQEQVVAREEYRKKVAELQRTFGKIMERAQALDYAGKRLSGALTDEMLQRCQDSGILLQAWILQLPGSIRYAAEKANGFSSRVERGGYARSDQDIAEEYESTKKAIDKLGEDITGAERRMRSFCSCLGVKFSVENPEGQTIFRTDSELSI